MSNFTIRDLTVKERILLHLSRYSSVSPGQEFNVPFDLTQDGIAMVVGITRSHASLDLKKLGEVGMVTYWQAHQKGVRSKRLVYSITPEGMEKAENTREKLKAEGIDADIFLDMRKCDPEIKWNSLGPRDRVTFGRACVFRVPVPRDTFPPTETGTLPSDVLGMTLVPRDVANSYLEKISPEEVREWNSWAADWWVEHDNPQERLFHLINAGRKMEAGKHAIRHKEEFMANPNEDLLDLLGSLGSIESIDEDLVWLKSQIAISCKRIETAKKLCKELRKMRSPVADIIEAQICMYLEDYDGAYDLARMAYDCMHTPLSAILMSQACARMGHMKEADDLAVAACDAMHRIGDAKDIDEILKVRAEIAYKNGDRESALALLGKAKAAAPDYKKGLLQNLIDGISDPTVRVVFS
ncbi:MAG: hypothetical protein MJZ21_01290 [archaeon]|nr:hypothetical protein [archaeon]